MFRLTAILCGAAAAATAGSVAIASAGPSGDAMRHGAMEQAQGALVKVVDSRYGRVIADRTGEAVYLFDRENAARSECYGKCGVAWPPLLTKGKPRAGAGTRQSLLGTTKRRDGKLQVTYAGHPLYHFQGDSPGNILCQAVDEFGGRWLVVKPSGTAVR
jgi:predicted lipoprotein with Yx(FWY)xxD motif